MSEQKIVQTDTEATSNELMQLVRDLIAQDDNLPDSLEAAQALEAKKQRVLTIISSMPYDQVKALGLNDLEVTYLNVLMESQF